MATKKILIQVILDDKARNPIKKTGKEVEVLASKVTILNEAQRQQIINDEKSAIQKKALITQLKLQAAAEMNAAAATGKGRAQSGLNNAILLETGRLASDAAYGFTAMANNLGQIVSLFSSFVETNKGVVASFKELGRSLLGMGGIMIGIQLLISFGPKLIKLFQNLGSETRFLRETFDKAGETVSGLAGKFEIYINVLQSSTQSEKNKQKAIKALKDEYPEFIESLDKSGISMDNVKDSTKLANEQIELQRTAILELAKSRAATNKIQEIQSEIINKKIVRDLDIISVGAENLSAEQMKAQANLLDVTSEFADMKDRERYSTLLRLADEEKEHNQFIKDKEKEIDLLSEYVNIELSRTSSGPDKKKYTKLLVDNFNKEIKAIKELGKIRSRFFNKNLAQDVKNKELQKDKIKLLRTQALAEVDAIKGGEVAKRQARLEINTYYDKLQEEAKTKREEKLKKIEDKFAVKSLKKAVDVADEDLFKEKDVIALEEKQNALLEKQKELDLAAIDKLTDSETEKEEAKKAVRDYYDNLALENEQKNADAREKITEIEKKSKLQALDDMGKGLMAASQIAGKATGAGKSLAVAGTLVSTYSAAQKAYESQMVPPSIDSPVRAAIAAASAIAQGLANVKAIMSVKVAGVSSPSVSGSGPTTVQAPDFNVVGQGVGSQLAGVVSNQFGGALRAYVVSGDISSAQELDRKINTTATIG